MATSTEALCKCPTCGAMTPKSRKTCVKCGLAVPPAVLAASTAPGETPLEDRHLLQQEPTEGQLAAQREWQAKVGRDLERDRAEEQRRKRADMFSYCVGVIVGLLGFGLLTFFILALVGWGPARTLLMQWIPR